MKFFYDCQNNDWDYIRIKITPDHPYNMHQKIQFLKILKQCNPKSFTKLNFSSFMIWGLAIGIAYVSILISWHRD